jgi:CubicO group peptidase (beta-lactamase class C family)
MRRLAGHLGVLALTLACLPAAAAASSQPGLQKVLDTALARQPVSPGIAAAVDRPGLRWRGAAGVLDRVSGSPLRASDGYRIASITKTFTGYILLGQLVESVSGRPQAAAYRQLLRLRRLGVGATYFETLEPKPRPAGRQASTSAIST